jgi:asparagine synthase (glutamine-hydrolysing)
MCGIVGFVDRDSGVESAQRLEGMIASIAHRGPDDSGMWFDSKHGIALGHKRLSILDLSSAGHQPMESSCGRYVIIFNGEIYNHLELRSTLKHDVAWRGHSDTESLLAHFTDFGIVATIESAVGMFAFAVWDRFEKDLYLARDRIGEKPLYYGWQSGCFLFGSELKSLLAHPACSKHIDWAAAGSFLRNNYIPGPSTIYKGIKKLPPGSFLRLSEADLGNKQLPQPEAYWSLETVAARGLEQPFTGSYSDAVDELESMVRRSVQQQSIADVAVGAFLSGGIDSSTVVAMMQGATSSKVKTFSIGVPDAGLDESVHGMEVAEYLGTEHVDYQLQPQDLLDTVARLTDIWDEPFADSSQVPTYIVSRLAATELKVALTGDGGDEFFLGYSQYQLFQKLWRYRALGKIPWESLTAPFSPLRKIPATRSLLRGIDFVSNAWRQEDQQALASYWMDKYRDSPLPLRLEESTPAAGVGGLAEAAETAALWNAATYLPDDILVKVDRASMANSLETRAPLLDHRIVEFSYRLPFEYKLQGSNGKRVLRDVLYRHVPRAMVDRPKAGFVIPLADWLRQELRPWISERLGNIPGDSDIFDKASVTTMWEQHLNGTHNHADRIWAIMILESFVGPSL